MLLIASWGQRKFQMRSKTEPPSLQAQLEIDTVLTQVCLIAT
jgi:hypothetical protein